ncbi:TRAP transporter substrate-binding protein [Azospirillum sp. Sh1]|uniref:TRAP transporter substrate-binding protein n=1 Tax=Azospirillum sp. Sh1 TaxID=2607285 RepID=UPI0011F02637|nr:TRAP transporter substrate-binding protein [Azospirillum sp. Sh1]KAA0578613.1 TRAP transporter substrate-binding protein [Azospirillum sp. Sh1]
MLKSIRPAAFALAALLPHIVASPAAAADGVSLKITHFLPPGAPAQQQVLEPWCKSLGEQSGGRISCQFYPAMQLGGTPAQLVDLAKNGVADIVWTAPGYSAGRFPIIETMELPFVVRDGLSGSRAAWDFYQRHAVEEFAAYKVLAVHVDGGVAIHTAGKPISGLDSLKGQKLRASTRMVSKMLAAVGAIPVNMPPAQVTEAISKGVVDGAMGAWEVVTPTKLQEVTKFHTQPPAGQPYYSTTVLTLLMNKERYQSLPPDLKAVIDRNSGPALVDSFGQVWDRVTADTRALVGKEGGSILNQDSADYEAMRTAAAPVETEWRQDVAKRGLDGAALAADARALAAR